MYLPVINSGPQARGIPLEILVSFLGVVDGGCLKLFVDLLELLHKRADELEERLLQGIA